MSSFFEDQSWATFSSSQEVIATSSRFGHATDEFVEFVVSENGPIEFELEVLGLSFDGNGDGVIDLLDVGHFLACLLGLSNDCDPFDVNDDGEINLLLVQPFVEAVTNSRNSEEFVIEFLSRSD